MTEPHPLDEALESLSIPNGIKQPQLRPLEPKERYVRTAGLKFIVPEYFSPGDVLDETTAALLNTFYTTAAINRFSETRRVLLDNPETTYYDIDCALQAHFDNFKYTPRPTRVDGSEPDNTLDRELISFARPVFNKHFGGKGLDRKDYENLLLSWVNDNREMLQNLMEKQNSRIKSLASDFDAAYGQD